MSKTNGFTKNADLYRTSKAHSELPDLQAVEEQLGELGGLACLDVATGTGHTAFFLAEKQAHVFAVDINDEMLRVAQEESDRLTLSVRFLKSPADDLMFDDHNFDLVTCRLAAHHFSGVDGFLREVARVLRPGGRLLLVDNVVPEDEAVAGWLNGFEKERDDSHVECFSQEAWAGKLEEAGFTVDHSERFPKDLDYVAWMERMSFDEEGRERMWKKLLSAPDGVQEFWSPRETSEGKQILTLQRQIVLASR